MPGRGRSGRKLVTPVVGFLGDVDGVWTARSSEVDEIFTVSISRLADPGRQDSQAHELPGGKIVEFKVFTGGPHKIWGLTAYVMHGVLQDALVDLRPPCEPSET